MGSWPDLVGHPCHRRAVHTGGALRIFAFGGKLNEASGLLQVRLLLATECGRLLAKAPIGPPDPDGPPFR